MVRYVLLVVLLSSTTALGATRYIGGIGFPTTETPGGESIGGTLDWGDPSVISSVDYDIEWGDDTTAGTMTLVLTNLAGVSAQLVYQDQETGLTMTAISADGQYELDAEKFVDDMNYGGFEAWTLTSTAPELNKYGTLTIISGSPVDIPVPEPTAQVVAMLGGLGLLAFRRWQCYRIDTDATA